MLAKQAFHALDTKFDVLDVRTGYAVTLAALNLHWRSAEERSPGTARGGAATPWRVREGSGRDSPRRVWQPAIRGDAGPKRWR